MSDVYNENNKQNLNDKTKALVLDEINNIDKILISVEFNDGDYYYGDIGHSFQSLDDLLKNIGWYKTSFPLRQQSGRNLMSDDKDKVKDGIKQLREWLEIIKKDIDH